MLYKPCRARERAFFQFPDDEQRRNPLLRFPNRSDAQEFKHVLICALHFSNYVRQSKFSGNLQRQEYFRKISWKHSRNRIASQLSLDAIIEKQMKSLGEGSFLEKEHL